ncbi:MAG TPA: DUF2273 domain-containing protein [Spirochaetota bacterium]|nr:DUF2273 domain-containing protein [Spirochaetota bacterium]HPV42743.1 DUF2273 domain-containing protein [Spirochaetota bacterium]
MDFFEQIALWIKENPGKTVGAAIGFVLGVLLFAIGWWKTLIILILVLIGFIIGKSRDENIPVIDLISSFFRRNRD